MCLSVRQPVLDAVEAQRGVQASRFTAKKDRVGVDDAGAFRRVPELRTSKLCGEQPAIEAFDVVAGQIAARQDGLDGRSQLRKRWCLGRHGVGDAVDCGRLFRNRLLGIDQ